MRQWLNLVSQQPPVVKLGNHSSMVFSRIDHELEMGWSRWSASVVEEGGVEVGSRVILLQWWNMIVKFKHQLKTITSALNHAITMGGHSASFLCVPISVEASPIELVGLLHTWRDYSELQWWKSFTIVKNMTAIHSEAQSLQLTCMVYSSDLDIEEYHDGAELIWM